MIQQRKQDLNFRCKRLLERILSNKERVYEADLGPGDRDRAEALLEKGLVRAHYGTWSGDKYYTGL